MSFEADEETLTLTDLISRGYSRSTLPSNIGDPSRRGSTMSAYITDFDNTQDEENETLSQNRDKFSLRQRSNKEIMNYNNSRISFIKTFILKTVVHKVNHGYDIYWLSELRQVSVLFINLDPGSLSTFQNSDEVDRKQHLLQSSFEVVFPFLAQFDGSLNKIFMFDKGCTFLCVFGLPHASHEDDPKRAVRAAVGIFNSLSSLKLQHYSIGVTTGIAFCGVVGHPQRHEYTVIGQKVNMAARLMMKFPDAVTCDERTYLMSNVPNKYFTLTPAVQLKGLSNPEEFYFVSTEHANEVTISDSDIHEPEDISTLIGRKHEMGVFQAELEHRMDPSNTSPGGVMILSGPGGIGKTKLLRAMKAKAVEMKFRVVSGTGGLIHQHTPFFAVRTLLTRLLELDMCRNIHEKEQLILEQVTDEDTKRLLPILNDLLVLKFPHTEETLHMGHKERAKNLHKLLFKIVQKKALDCPCLFGVDDAQWIDHDSWKFLLDLALDPNAILLLAARPLAVRPLKDIQKSDLMRKIWNHPNTILLELEGLSCEEMIEMAHQILNVDHLPEEITSIIQAHSHGVPLWCEELIETMLELNVLSVLEEDKVIFEEDEDSKPDENDTSKSSQTKRTVVFKGGGSSGKKRRRRRSCVSQTISIDNFPIPDSVAGMVLTRIDNMNPSEQMSLKCAAVLGTTFYTEMLEAIIPNCNPIVFKRTLNSLAAHGIIECSVAAEIKARNSDMQTSKKHPPNNQSELYCPCLSMNYTEQHQQQQHHVSTHGTYHPPITDCKHLQFVHSYIQETAYGLWTNTQCQSLHEKAAVFLESQAHKCVNCGGGGFFTGYIGAKKKSSGSSIKGRSFMGAATIRHKLIRSNDGRWRRSNRISSIHSSDSSTPSQTFRRKSFTLETMCATDLHLNLQDCHCDDILYYVYPQLVQHWRAAGNLEKTLHYLIECAAAALSTFNNMEAISLLQEADEIMKDDAYKDVLSPLELAKLEGLFGQAYFQCGEVDECMPFFRTALQMLGTRLPTTKIGILLSLICQAIKQELHIKFPNRYIGKKKGIDSDKFLEQSRCMALVTHVYHLQHKNLKTLMAALQQLNAAEEAQEDIHELVESYAIMIECCQLFDFTKYGDLYLKKAFALCSSVQFGVEDISTYSHLLNVALNYKLCHGKINEALEIGLAVTKITSKVHDLSMKLPALPLLFEAHLQALKIDNCEESLQQLVEVSDQSDDLRAEALVDCCRFDALLEIGLEVEIDRSLIQSAELCCEEDIYRFDDTGRFFLISSLAVWHSRKHNITTAKKLVSIAKSIMPKMYETFFAVKALVKYLECHLLLFKDDRGDRRIRKTINKELKVIRKVVEKFRFFIPRYLHFKAYFRFIQTKDKPAKSLLRKAAKEAKTISSKFESAWIAKSYSLWFENKLVKDSPGIKLYPLH